MAEDALTFSKEDVADTPRKSKLSGLAQLLSSGSPGHSARGSKPGSGALEGGEWAASAAPARPASPPPGSPQGARRASLLVYSCRVFVRPGAAVTVNAAADVSPRDLLEAVGARWGTHRLSVAGEDGREDDEFPPLDGALALHSFGVHNFCVVPPLEKRPAASEAAAAAAAAAAVEEEEAAPPPPAGSLEGREAAEAAAGREDRVALWVGRPGPSASAPGDASPETRLLEAAAAGDVDAVIALTEQGVDPNASAPGGWTALHLAARGGHLALVGYLAKSGARLRVDARTEREGLTALQVCAQRGHYEAAELLLLGGADPAGAAREAALFGHADLAELASEFEEEFLLTSS